MNKCVGFAKIRCLDQSVQYDSSSNKLSVIFLNAAGTNVAITDIKVSGDCTTGLFEEMEVKVGETTQFFCTGTRKNKGGGVRVNLDITYTKKIGDDIATFIDSGGIIKTVE